jgi:hypothetical protein
MVSDNRFRKSSKEFRMNKPSLISRKLTIDWRWVGVGYCFFVVLHLLPTVLFNIFFGLKSNPLSIMPVLYWLYFGLFYVGFYIGYRSRDFTVIESGLAGTAYGVTLVYLLPSVMLIPLKVWEGKVSLIISLFVVATISAWVGEIVQMRKERKMHQLGQV